MKQFPYYIKYPVILLAIAMIYLVFSHGKIILLPLAMAVILALSIYPIFEFYHKKGVPEIVAILLAIVSVFTVIFIIGTIVYFQLLRLIDDSPQYIAQIEQHLSNIQIFIEDNFDVQSSQQIEYISQQINNLVLKLPDLLLIIFNKFFDLVFYTILISMYVFLFLYYRDKFKSVFIEVFSKIVNEEKIKRFYKSTNEIIQNYIGGLFLVMLLLAILNSIALTIIGIDHAIFFGVLAALLTIIPYIGVFIGSSLPIIFAIITKDSLVYPIAILITFDVIQFLEGNFITPNIMGNKVNLSPLMIIIALFIGGLLWGPIGMILAVPYLAILKIILENNRDTKPYADIITGFSYEGDDSIFKKVLDFFSKFLKSKSA